MSNHRQSGEGAIASTIVIIIAVLVVAVLAGFFVLAIGNSPSNPSSVSTTNGSSIVSNAHTSSRSSTASHSSSNSSSITLSGTILTSGQGTKATNITFASNSGTFTTPISNGLYSVTLPDLRQYNVAVTWAGNYSWQKGVTYATFVVNQSSGPALTKDWTIKTPTSLIHLSGSVSSSGNGTQVTSVTFNGNHGESISCQVRGGTYSVDLPNEENYSVMIIWNGSYSWQTGTIDSGQYAVNDTVTSSLSKNLNASTPDSKIVVSGNVSTSGPGTQPVGVTFSSTRNGIFNASMVGDQYSVTLPNDASYEASVVWAGAFSWQRGNVSTQLDLNATSGVSRIQDNLQNIDTPASTVTLVGAVATTGQGTFAKQVSFSSSQSGIISAPVSGQQYKISLPNGQEYSVTIEWQGQYSWQSGSVSDGDLTVQQPEGGGSVLSENLSVMTPNSVATVSGTIKTNGTGTQATSITYAGESGTFRQSVLNGEYDITLPNMVSYNVSIQWTGLYSWQNGTKSTTIAINVGAENSATTVDWLLNTPDSIVTVTGNVTTAGLGTNPTLVTFKSSSGEITVTVQVVNNQYSVTLPNMMTYNVTVYWKGVLGSSGTCNPNALSLDVIGSNATFTNLTC